MEQSLFIDWVKKYFPKLAVQLSKEIKEQETQYLHQKMLGKKFTLDTSWESITSEYKNIAADVVSMDSRLDEKSRGSIKTASGDIPKLGMIKSLTEKQLKKLDVLVTTNAPEKEILKELFADLKYCIKGIYDRLEYLFLKGLSTGIAITDDDKDASIGIRANFGYYASHKLPVAFDWSNAQTATPIDDIDSVLEQAQTDGRLLSTMIIPTKLINQARKANQTIEQYASAKDTIATDKSPAVSKNNFIEWIRDEKGLEIIELKKNSIPVEKGGVGANLKPWKESMIIFLENSTVGDLVWTELAEMNHKKQGVEYQTVDDFILTSKYHEVNPLKEFTSSQAMVLPVITDVGGIYQLDTADIQNESFDSDTINLDQEWQKVIADVKLNLNVDALNAALTAEQAKTKPRGSVVSAIEARITELGTSGGE